MRSLQSLGAATLLALGLLCAPRAVLSHAGGLDSSGCHTNRKTGEHHCHGAPATEGAGDSAVVKKSKSGICHAPSSPWYGQTVHFTAYRTLQQCLDSGGRLPRS